MCIPRYLLLIFLKICLNLKKGQRLAEITVTDCSKNKPVEINCFFKKLHDKRNRFKSLASDYYFNLL